MARKKTKELSRSIRLTRDEKKILHAMLAYFAPVEPIPKLTETEIVTNWAIRGMIDTWRDTKDFLERLYQDPDLQRTAKTVRAPLKDPAFKHDSDATEFVLESMQQDPVFAEILAQLEKDSTPDSDSGNVASDPLTKFFRKRKPHPDDEVIVLYPPNDVFRSR